MNAEKGKEEQEPLNIETQVIIDRLIDRNLLLDTARKKELRLSAGASVVLQANKSMATNQETGKVTENAPAKPGDILEAVQYRLAITDLFVEKAQYHLEDRARRYKRLGYTLFAIAIVLFIFGAISAGYRMMDFDQKREAESKQQVTTPKVLVPPSAPASILSQSPIQKTWIDLLHGFIVAFTAYGFIVLTAVALTRGARACLDQRERLLAKRHSLRQGRLYLHLSGGNVTIEDMERAFNWNHEQHNAFTNMPTDAKAPWGNVVEEIIKIVPELVKANLYTSRWVGWHSN